MGIQLPAELIANVDAWAKEVSVRSRSEAIRRLVEFGLAGGKSARPPSARTAERAKQLAAKTIDHLLDPRLQLRERPTEGAGCSKGRRNFAKCASIFRRKPDPLLGQERAPTGIL